MNVLNLSQELEQKFINELKKNYNYVGKINGVYCISGGALIGFVEVAKTKTDIDRNVPVVALNDGEKVFHGHHFVAQQIAIKFDGKTSNSYCCYIDGDFSFEDVCEFVGNLCKEMFEDE